MALNSYTIFQMHSKTPVCACLWINIESIFISRPRRNALRIMRNWLRNRHGSRKLNENKFIASRFYCLASLRTKGFERKYTFFFSPYLHIESKLNVCESNSNKNLINFFSLFSVWSMMLFSAPNPFKWALLSYPSTRHAIEYLQRNYGWITCHRVFSVWCGE